ncbi:Os01g0392800, partial [Oryza sativa Japonica Group]
LNLLWSKIFCFNCLLNQWICLLRVQHLKKKFYFHFQDYVDLIIWKVPTVYPLLTLSLTLFPYFYFLKSFLTLHLEPI